MRYDNLETAIAEAFRFIEKALELREMMERDDFKWSDKGGKSPFQQTRSSVRRSSQDLSRALVTLRSRDDGRS